MSTQHEKKHWQFSIAHLLILTLLAACVLAAFRWHPVAGAIACSIFILGFIVVMRTRAAMRQERQESGKLASFSPQEQVVVFAYYSTMIAVPAMSLCFFGIATVYVLGSTVGEVVLHSSSPLAHLHVENIGLAFLFLGCVPITFGTAWMVLTWPRSRSAKNRASLSPLGQNRLN